jgi:hypothetical protein
MIGYHLCVDIIKPFLNDAAMAKKLALARSYGHYSRSDWALVIFTDESAMQCRGPSRMWVTRQSKEAMHTDYLMAQFRKLLSCLVGGGITGYRKGPLVFWDREEGEYITGKSYIAHILPELQELWAEMCVALGGDPASVIVMQDNAPLTRL